MKKYSLLSLLLFFFLPCYSQINKVDETYPNGQLKYKGKYIKCYSHVKNSPIIDIERRPFGKWIYYYPSGVVSEIRVYTKKIKSCEEKVLKEGEWKYFNEEGKHYLTKRYVHDTLVFSEIELYENQSLIGQITLTKNDADTLFYEQKEETHNLIPNPSFDQYFYKPIPIENDGMNPIENIIFNWVSPDGATPDYYNQYRRVAGIPKHFMAEEGGTEANGYVGLMLFLGEKIEPEMSLAKTVKGMRSLEVDYKESIQAKLNQKLKKGKNYCFKAQMLLSRNAGYAIDRLEVLFTEHPIRFSYEESLDSSTFSLPIAEVAQNWTTLCKGFTATGHEAYINLGRFSLLEAITVKTQIPKQNSELGVNGAAYYLLDDLQLYEVESLSECGCSTPQQWTSDVLERRNFDEIELEEISVGSKFILSHINFDHDKAEIKDPFLPELSRLANYLKTNHTVRIMIYGHTDNEGTEAYNQNLSEIRAEAIKIWLVENGIEEDRIEYIGLGSQSPLVENIDETSRQINRRVEVEIVER